MKGEGATSGGRRLHRERKVRGARPAAVGLVIALVLSAASAMAGASLPWEPVPPPATFGGPFSGWDEAWAVDCVDQTFCMATGEHARIARWDGSAWTELPRALLSGDLRSVSCASRSFCLAVGWLDSDGLIVRWDGSAWSVVSPAIDPGRLGNVDCTSETFCLMTGAYATALWDGTSTSVVAGPYAGAALEGGLDCTGPAFCVGTVGRDGWFTTGPRIFHWDGSEWTPAFSNQPGGSERLVSDVSCQTTTACTAVGFEEYENANLRSWVFHWDGTSWTPSLAADPSGSANNVLVGVSCESAAECVAVGARGGDALSCCEEPWLLRWSPGMLVEPVTDATTDLDILRDVDCVTPFGCVAVGFSSNDLVGFAFSSMGTLPSAPPTPVASAGPALATVSWTAPAADGGWPVTGYVVTPSIGFFPLAPRIFDASSTTRTVTGLTPGTTYRFRVQAITDFGTGGYSRATNAVTPSSPAPSAPTIGPATPGNQQATVSWTAPTSEGTAPIIGYIVTPYIGYAPQGPRYFLSTATSQTITGLTNGVTYRFRVRALNGTTALHVSPFSATSNPITPAL